MHEHSESVRDAHFRELNAHQQEPAYNTLNGYEERAAFFAQQVGRKWEIDQAVYEEFLDLLPPLGYRADNFYMSEFLFDDISRRFSREGNRYFCEVAYYPPRPTAPSAAVPNTTPDVK